jgi:hypothetical protein
VISTEGSVRAWDDNWRTLAVHEQQLYRQGRPRTLIQFWHQCYRLHHAVMRRLASGPRLKTFASVAICELLTGRKPLAS